VVTVLRRRLSPQGRHEPSCLGSMWSGDDHEELDKVDNTCGFQRAELSLGDFQYVWIQAAGFCINQAAECLNKMSDSMTLPWCPLTITHNAGKRRQEGADSRDDVRNGRSKPGWGGGDSATDRLQGIGEQNGSCKGATNRR
jgi:hypothetical protein